MLFLSLATLRIDTSLLGDVEELRWRGPAPNFEAMSRYLREGALGARMTALAAS
jgi:hypothetical protein